METNSTKNNQEMIDAWYEKVVSSCAHHDSDQAYSAWRKWDEMIGLVSPEQKSEVMNLQEELTYTAFPSFPQDIATSLIEKHLISFLRSLVDIDEMIQNRFLYAGYGFEEGERKALREAALKNTELVGEKAVSEWLRALDEAFAKAEDPENVMMKFFTEDPAIASMSRLDQAILRRLFQVYYDFLAFPVMTVYGLAESARKLAELEKSGVKEINLKEFFAPDRTAPQDFTTDISQDVASSRQGVVTSSEKASLPLLKALGKFEKLGGQQVTNSKIVVKGQNDPVRPTIFNWLRAYRDELGVGAHDSVVRGQFLFHSLNGKGLSSDERDQVGMLLKSIDENTPLTIDAGRQEVVFREQGTRNREQGARNREQGATRTTVVPPAGGASAVHERNTFQTADAPLKSGTTVVRDAVRTQGIENSGRTPQKGERPMFASQEKNISRAVFELPTTREQGIENREQGTGNSGRTAETSGTTAIPQGIPSAFEQAKAIQAAARENQISMAQVASETVELGRVNAFPMAPRPRIEPAPQNTAPAPRAISFEPAKIDTFSFGAGRGSNFQTTKPIATRTGDAPHEINKEFHGVNRSSPEKNNVGEVSFSTKHVMPAEKEKISEQRAESREQRAESREQGAGNREQGIGSREQRTENREQGAGNREQGTGNREQIASVTPVMPTPVIQKPVTPVNRFRISPTGRRDSAPSDATPSPHVVDLRS